MRAARGHQGIFLSPLQRQTIQESDIVVISDYNKGYLTTEDIENIL